MNKDTNLIFEAYVEESKARATVLGLMCALGFGCATTKEPNPREPNLRGPEKSIESKPSILDILFELGPFIEAWLRSGVSDEQRHHLKAALIQQSEHGEPIQGWEKWFIDWSKNERS